MAPQRTIAPQQKPVTQLTKEALESLEAFASETTGKVREISADKKDQRVRLMRKWNSFFNENYVGLDPERLWIDLCCDDNMAKSYCRVFLQWYVTNSGRLEVCLGPEEHEWKREVTATITIAEVWKCLVVEADSTVLLRKRKEDPTHRKQWVLAYAERDKTGPVADISRVCVASLSSVVGIPIK
ncbi:hypothetical protein GGR54DRAFT_326193 [Hypoxylon sp. NC1633]|nr:hypothetical protein GGR54DRAFT_326193 [Hypoxylon sp. NC1633]